MPTDGATHRHAAPCPLAPVGTTSVARDCDGGRVSAEAGIVLRTAIDAHLGLTRALAAGLAAPRAAPRRHLPPADWLTQRVCPMAAGSEEAHASTLRRDAPSCQLLRARLLAPGAPWASLPPSARLAHRLARPALSRLARVLRQPGIAASARPPPGRVRAVDAPAAPGHGAPEQARDAGSEGGAWVRPLPR